MKSTRKTWLTLMGLPAMLLALTMWQSGCGNGDTSGDDTSTSTGDEDGDHDDHDHGDHDHGDHDHGDEHADGDSDGDEVTQALDELSPEDREIAMAQKTCPVADGPLGGMGVPIKVEHDGQVVFLCCKGCKEAFEEDPAKYIALLDGDESGDSESVPEATDPEPESDSETTPETEESEPSAESTDPEPESDSESAPESEETDS